MWAEHESLQLAQAFANRAFVWLKLKQYDNARMDLETVLKSDKYPKESMFKINQRLANVYQNLGENDKSVECSTKAINLLQHSNLSANQKSQVTQEIKINIKNIKLLQMVETQSIAIIYDQLDIIDEHDDIPEVTKKLKVEYSELKGRYSVANETIYPGEVIIKTKAVASTVKPHNSKDYCYNCLLFTMAPIPCCKCSAIIFCSLFCYEAAKERQVFLLIYKLYKKSLGSIIYFIQGRSPSIHK